MNTESNIVPDAQVSATAVISWPQQMYWSVRRELWENRAIYIAPLIAAAVFLFGFLINMMILRRHIGVSPLDPAQQQHLFFTRYELAAGLIMGTAFIVGIFYTLDALYGERRDRSILFWKSLPVSDLTVVLSKLTIPLVLLPLLSFAIAIATQLLMLMVSSAIFVGSGINIAHLWTEASFFHVSLVLLYHIITVHGLWYAPLYGWLLLVSAWAPRAPFLWAFLPPFVICGVEKLAFNTRYCQAMLEHRLTGPEASTAMTAGGGPMDPMAKLIPAHFLSEPGLWLGLAVAAAFLFAAVRVRRWRGPI